MEVAETSDDILNGSAHSAVGADVDLVEHDVHSSLLVQLLGNAVTELLVNIKERKVLHTGLGKSLGHVVAQSTSAAGMSVSEVSGAK